MGCGASGPRNDPWEDDPPDFVTEEGGTWTKYKDVDMCGQGDVEIIGDWKRSRTIQQLKRIVEAKGYSAFTVSDSVRRQERCLARWSPAKIPLVLGQRRPALVRARGAEELRLRALAVALQTNFHLLPPSVFDLHLHAAEASPEAAGGTQAPGGPREEGR